MAGLLIALSGCGGGGAEGDRQVAFVGAPAPGCTLGGTSPVSARRVDPAIIKPESPALIVACDSSSFTDGFYVVGFDTDKGLCVSVDSERQGESYGFICKFRGESWFDLCQDRTGCILRSEYVHGFTEIAGLVSPEVRGMRASVEGEDEIGGLAIGTARAGLLRRLDTKEPFGFFALFLPGCVGVDEMRLEMLDEQGKSLGLARETGGPPSPCGDQRT